MTTQNFINIILLYFTELMNEYIYYKYATIVGTHYIFIGFLMSTFWMNVL